MTFSMDSDDFMQVIEIASIVGTVVAAVLIGFVIYLMVRPKRGSAAPPQRDIDAIDAETVIAVIDRMESRLAVLERAIGHEDAQPRFAPREQENFEAAEGGRDLGRMK